MLNLQKGNMYNWVTHTWNPIKGKCSHDCSYCYMKAFPQTELHFVEKELTDDLGSGNYIFVGSSTDMFANDVPGEWIKKVLLHCKKYPNNKYLFQSKNPGRFCMQLSNFKEELTELDCVLGTTIETNRERTINHHAPPVFERYFCMRETTGFKKMVTIEPILDFDLAELVVMLEDIKPDWVNIGADSKGHNLPEPNKEKILQLIAKLQKFTEVKCKDNLNRLSK